MSSGIFKSLCSARKKLPLLSAVAAVPGFGFQTSG